MPSIPDVLAAVEMLASTARSAGSDALAADLESVCRKHAGTASQPVAETVEALAEPDTANDAVVPVAAVEPVVSAVQAHNDEDDHEEEVDEFAALREVCDEITDGLAVDATIRDLQLLLTGSRDLDEQTAVTVADIAADAIQLRFGDVEVGEVRVDGRNATVELKLADGNDGAALTCASAGVIDDVFNADIPVGENLVQVTTAVGVPADVDLARELGLFADAETELPAVAQGLHPVHGMLDLIEQQTGHRPVAGTVLVRYTKADGTEFTDDQLRETINHPVAVANMRRLGDLAVLETTPGPAAQRTVTYGVLAAAGAERRGVDPALLGLFAAIDGQLRISNEIGVVRAQSVHDLDVVEDEQY